MKYQVNGRVSGGGWGMTIEASSPEAALVKAIESERAHPHENGEAYEITVGPDLAQMGQQQADHYANCMMSVPDPYLTVTRGRAQNAQNNWPRPVIF